MLAPDSSKTYGALRRIDTIKISDELRQQDGEHCVHVIRALCGEPVEIRIRVSEGEIVDTFVLQDGRRLECVSDISRRLEAAAAKIDLPPNQMKLFSNNGRRPRTRQRGRAHSADMTCFWVGEEISCWTCIYVNGQLLGCYELGGESFVSSPGHPEP